LELEIFVIFNWTRNMGETLDNADIKNLLNQALESEEPPEEPENPGSIEMPVQVGVIVAILQAMAELDRH
jgi:hypothetical protein